MKIASNTNIISRCAPTNPTTTDATRVAIESGHIQVDPYVLDPDPIIKRVRIRNPSLTLSYTSRTDPTDLFIKWVEWVESTHLTHLSF